MALRGPQPGQIIREARKAAGLTQEALAAEIGCSKPQLSLMESGQRTVSQLRARQIEQALGLEDGRIVKAVHWQAAPEEWKRSMTDARDLTDRLREALAGSKPLDELREIGAVGAGTN